MVHQSESMPHNKSITQKWNAQLSDEQYFSSA